MAAAAGNACTGQLGSIYLNTRKSYFLPYLGHNGSFYTVDMHHRILFSFIFINISDTTQFT